MLHALLASLRARRAWTVLALAAVTAGLGFAAAGLRRDNSLEAWIAPDDPEWVRFRDFREEFSVVDPLIVYLPGCHAAETEAAVRRVRTLPGVARVTRLAFDEPPPGSEAACALSIDPAPDANPQALSRLGGAVTDVLTETLPGRPAALGGVWWITEMLDRGSDAATRSFFPLVLALLAVSLLAFVRPARDAALAFATGVLPAVQVSGLMAACGQPLNIVLVAVPPLTLILGITYSVHLLLQTRHVPQGVRRAAMAGVVVPSAAAMGTTVLGFGSLLFSDLLPVRQLGTWGAAGVGLAFVDALVLVPAFAAETAFEPPRGDRSLAWVAWLRRHRWTSVATGAVAVVLAAAGMTRLGAESHVLRFFSESSSVRADYRRIEDAGIGLTPIEVSCEVAARDFPRVRDGIGEFADAQPAVTHLLWPMDAAGRLRGLEPTARGAFLTPLPLPDETDPLLEIAVPARPLPSGRRATLFLRTPSTEATVAFVAELERFLADRFGTLGQFHVTGSVTLLVRMQDRLLRTLLRSFSTAFVSIAAVMALALRSWRMGLLAIVPNLIPVLVMLGTMGWAGIALDVATVTVASIAFSVVVDDTIHFLHAYREGRAAGMGPGASIAALLDRSGRAMIAVSCVSSLSFLGFLGSPFVPLRDFGLLTALTFGLGLVCDLALLPALLLAFSREDARA